MRYAYKSGDFVEIVGARYGEIEGMIGKVMGTLSPFEGQPAYEEQEAALRGRNP